MRWVKAATVDRGPSRALEEARRERDHAQRLLDKTREATDEIERIAADLEKERVANHFAEALAVSWARQARARE